MRGGVGGATQRFLFNGATRWCLSNENGDSAPIHKSEMRTVGRWSKGASPVVSLFRLSLSLSLSLHTHTHTHTRAHTHTHTHTHTPKPASSEEAGDTPEPTTSTTAPQAVEQTTTPANGTTPYTLNPNPCAYVCVCVCVHVCACV